MGNRKKVKKKARPTRLQVIEGLHRDYAWLRDQEIRLQEEKEADDARGSSDLSVQG